MDPFAVVFYLSAIEAVLGGYILGSIPFGLVITRLAGLGDIRAIGSGNIGATNVLRTGNYGLAAATLVLDAAKGALAVVLAARTSNFVVASLAAIFVIIGHCFPVWLRFKGGKGVATGLGALLALDWHIGLCACLAWIASFALTKISSASALLAFAAASLASAYVIHGRYASVCLFMTILVWWRHRANIARLLAGTEPRFGRRG